MRLNRRHVLAGMALTASPLRAGGIVPSAADMARAVSAPRDATPLDIKDENGMPISLAEWRGRWVLLNLWAPWCLPCRREMPSLMRLSTALDPANAVVLPLAFERRGPIWVHKFYREEGITGLPVLLGDGKNVDRVLGLSNLPTTALINPEGQHVQTVAGEAVWDDVATLAWLGELTG